MVNAVVLAGSDEHSKIYGKSKASLKVGEFSLIEYVLDALEHSRYIEDIFVVGSKSELEGIVKDHEIIQENGGMLKNIIAGGNAAMNDENFVFFIAADIPFVTKEGINDIIYKSCPSYVINFPLVRKKIIEDFIKRNGLDTLRQEYNELKEGCFRTANCAMINFRHFKQNDALKEITQNITDSRKVTKLYYQLKLSRDVGLFGPVIRYNLSKLATRMGMPNLIEKVSIDGLKAIGVCMTGMFVNVIETDYPHLAIDIDNQDHYEFIKRLDSFQIKKIEMSLSKNVAGLKK